MGNVPTKKDKAGKVAYLAERREKNASKEKIKVAPRASVQYLEPRAVAEMLSMSREAVYQLVYRRRIPFYKFGRRLLFREDEIITFMESQRVEEEPLFAEAMNLTDPRDAA